MNKNSICIATITWARDEEEQQLLQRSLAALSSLQIPVFVTDGGSTHSFIEFLNTIPHFTVGQAKQAGVFAQIKQSLDAAFNSNASFALYTEPDKEMFFKTGLLQMLKEINANENTGVVLATRSQQAFSSFPTFQQMTETCINNCCAELIKKELDYTYGPFLLNKKLLSYLNDVKENIGWGWRPYVFNIANRLGLDVHAIEKDFYCPQDQQNDSSKERIYRMKQLEENIRALVLSTSADLKI